MGLSLTLYQAWLYVAVFSSAFLFGGSAEPRAFDDVFLFPLSLQPALIIAFLAVSGFTLLAIAALARKAPQPLQSKPTCIAAACLCIAGTLLTALGDGLGGMAPILAGLAMGLGSSVFLVLWGAVYAHFRFMTAVLNAAISFAVGMVLAVAIVSWIPSPASGVITSCLPIGFLALFWGNRYLETNANESRVPSPNMVGYYTRLAICLALFGIALGTMRAICTSAMLSPRSIAIELLLGASCITSVLIFVCALVLSKKETRWDWLFRTIVPFIVLGAASLPLTLAQAAFLSMFFFALGYLCLEVLAWVLLSSLASEINGTFIFGLGFGTLNLASIVGIVIVAFVLGTDVSLIGSHDLLPLMQNNLALIALLIVVLVSFGYALLPRYYEFKTILSSVLNEMLSSQTLQDDTAEVSESMSLKTSDAPGNANETPDIAAIPKDANVPDTSVSTDNADDDEPIETKDEKGSFTRRCDEISRVYKLSGREREVLFLLAKGHNASFILDKLCISRSTVKTHINHIYKKLDIHTQQELLNMVEDRKRHVDSTPHKQPVEGIATGAMGAAVKQDPEALKEVVLRAHIQHHS